MLQNILTFILSNILVESSLSARSPRAVFIIYIANVLNAVVKKMQCRAEPRNSSRIRRASCIF